MISVSRKIAMKYTKVKLTSNMKLTSIIDESKK